MPAVRDAHEHPSQDLEWISGLGPRRWPLRFAGSLRHGFRGAVLRTAEFATHLKERDEWPRAPDNAPYQVFDHTNV